jgi:hypothetical protein
MEANLKKLEKIHKFVKDPVLKKDLANKIDKLKEHKTFSK